MTINQQQITKVRQRFSSVNVPSWSGASFGISVGAVIPETVTLVDVPPAIIEIVPEWRRYKVVKVGNRIIIVDPGPRRIIQVIEVG